MPYQTENKLAALHARLGALARDGWIAVAFSGGLDSRFLAHAAKLGGLRPLLLHAEGPHIAAAETAFALEWAQENEFDYLLLAANPLEVPEVAANGRMRCYHCKHALFSRLLREAAPLALCDGTQASDSKAYRPGVAALRELGVASPLADAGLTKPEIRALAASTGMSFPEQHARPCLLTRFAYGMSPDEKTLRAFDQAEALIEGYLRLFAARHCIKTPDFRLRQTKEGAELHLTPFPLLENESLAGTLRKQLEECAADLTGRPLAAIRQMESLSGYFDKESA